MWRAVALIPLLLIPISGCRKEPRIETVDIGRDLCHAVRKWTRSPWPQGKSERGLSFQFIFGEDSIPFTATVFGEHDDAHDRALLDTMGSLTHYIYLYQLADGMIKCFNVPVEITKDTEGMPELVYSQFSYRDRRITIHWSASSCFYDESVYQGCLRITVQPAAPTIRTGMAGPLRLAHPTFHQLTK